MSGWKNTDAQANNEPSYITHIGMPQPITNNYSNNTVLVDASRLANANVQFGVSSKGTSHTGWVHYQHGTGSLASITVANVTPGLVYSNDYLTIVGANTASFVNTPYVAANAQIIVTGANTITIQINSVGSGFIQDPTVVSSTSGNANNATLVFTGKAGGRANRVKSEVLVALSSPTSTNANGAEPWFHGV